jgi:hypothetical protein
MLLLICFIGCGDSDVDLAGTSWKGYGWFNSSSGGGWRYTLQIIFTSSSEFKLTDSDFSGVFSGAYTVSGDNVSLTVYAYSGGSTSMYMRTYNVTISGNSFTFNGVKLTRQ